MAIFLPTASPLVAKTLTATNSMWAWMRDITAATNAVIAGGITSLTGDVTGTGPGATATTISNDAVTFAKMQDISTQRVIGRNTAGTGNPEEVTMTQALDWLP